MIDLYTVKAGERETVRAFAVAVEPNAAKKWASVQSNIETALGIALDFEHVEVFPAEDLKGLGLAQFLIDGYGVDASAVEDDRDLLDLAGSYIVLMRARAFAGQTVELDPKPPLMPLGAYQQASAEPTRPTAARELEPSAKSGVVTEQPRASKSALPLVLIFAALAVLLFAVLIVPKL